ncbi:MAG: Gfo/Idh/MocA family oxidoreductase [Ignavibacteriales bacterium]|nr:Gfo/Idh/MocA family oxidoreductase [Ignavibacteriales bacterium]
MKRIRYGIIGFGNFAEKTIAPAIRASANSELVAIQKRSLQAAQERASQYRVPLAFDSVKKLVDHPDVDAVFIVSANSAHCLETIAAAKAGKHVLVEKPMAMNVKECELMISACRENDVRLMVGHMVRLSPLVVRMKEIVHSGRIGNIAAIKTEFIYNARISQRSWVFDQKLAGGGPLFDIGVHCLDTMRFILDDEIVSVKSWLAPLPTSTRTESTAAVVLGFSKGTSGSLFCSYSSPIRRSFIEIVGTEGILSAVDFTRSSLTIPLNFIQLSNTEEGARSVEQITVPNLYVEEVSTFSDCLLNGSPPIIPGNVGLVNQRILDEALRQGFES